MQDTAPKNPLYVLAERGRTCDTQETLFMAVYEPRLLLRASVRHAHSPNTYLLNPYCVPGATPTTGHTDVNARPRYRGPRTLDRTQKLVGCANQQVGQRTGATCLGSEEQGGSLQGSLSGMSEQTTSKPGEVSIPGRRNSRCLTIVVWAPLKGDRESRTRARRTARGGGGTTPEAGEGAGKEETSRPALAVCT